MKNRNKRQARVKTSRVVYRGKIFRVRREVVEEPALPGGRKSRQREVLREIVEHHGSVAVLPVLPNGRVLLVRQYRHAARAFLWELVAGHIEPGENSLTAARRELREETGYSARHFQRMTEFFPSPGFLSEKMILYRATGLRAGQPRPEDDEALEVRAFGLPELLRMIRRDKLRDAKTLVGILLHARSSRSGRKT